MLSKSFFRLLYNFLYLAIFPSHCYIWTTKFEIHATQKKDRPARDIPPVCVCLYVQVCICFMFQVWTGSKFLPHTPCCGKHIVAFFFHVTAWNPTCSCSRSCHTGISLASVGFINTSCSKKSASPKRYSFTPHKFHPLPFPHTSKLKQQDLTENNERMMRKESNSEWFF